MLLISENRKSRDSTTYPESEYLVDGLPVPTEAIRHLANLSDAEVPILSVAPDPLIHEGSAAYKIKVEMKSTGRQFHYASNGNPDEWSTPEGNRDLQHNLSQANAIFDPDYWRAEPTFVLDASVVLIWIEYMITLSKKVDEYNEALRRDLQRARTIALGQ